MDADGRYDDDVRARISSEMTERLEQLALDRSEPGDRVTSSDLLREAVAEYLARHDA